MNEELIRQCAREAAGEFDWFDHDTAEETATKAIRLYHARHVAPLVDALDEAHGELAADSTRDTVRCLLLTAIEKALAPFQQEATDAAD